MPKDRRYTRKELESLRRADLQSLFKMHGMKGANQSTKAMVDVLVALFESPTYCSPNRRNIGQREKPRKLLGGSAAPALSKSVRDVRKRSLARPVADEVIQLSHGVDEIRTADILVERNAESSYDQGTVFRSDEPSVTTLPVTMPPPMPAPHTLSSAGAESRIQEMLEARDRIWEARLVAMERAFEERVKHLERRVEEAVRGLNGALENTSSTPINTVLGKRVERDDQLQTPGAGPSRSSPIAKRQRVETTEDEDSDIPLPHTPSPARMANLNPRTPSPSHQGTITDNSRTPGVGNEFFPPAFDGEKGDEAEVRGLPYPVFATTPRPSEPRSPTLDAPPSVKRMQLNYQRGRTLTPGPAPRSVSEAHKELTTITESDEASIPITLARRRVASENTPTRLVPGALRGASVPVSPPQLSPSPSIGASEREGGFTYTPFPAVPRAQSTIKKSNLGQSSPGRRHGEREMNRSVSPLDYMDIAMQGMEGRGETGVMATPHRTMLGTERYRDTRFGDVPVVSWGSPSVDLGPNTPASTRRRTPATSARW